MKETIEQKLERLEIDSNLHPLMRQLWCHSYHTLFSCQGGGGTHSFQGYLAYKTKSGDGWFERHAAEYGFYKPLNQWCCEVFTKPENNFCTRCGSGVNGVTIYRSINGCGMATYNSIETYIRLRKFRTIGKIRRYSRRINNP